jgi:Tfp pilus assembly protein FimT
MSVRTPPRANGLSLVELLLGLAITALVMAPLAPMMQTASTAALIADDRIALEREADFALERIAARIRATTPSSELLSKDNEEWLKPAVYTQDGSTLTEKQGNDSYILAESVKEFKLETPSASAAQPVIVVRLTLEREAATGTTATPTRISTTATATIRMGSAR